MTVFVTRFLPVVTVMVTEHDPFFTPRTLVPATRHTFDDRDATFRDTFEDFEAVIFAALSNAVRLSALATFTDSAPSLAVEPAEPVGAVVVTVDVVGVVDDVVDVDGVGNGSFTFGVDLSTKTVLTVGVECV